MSPALQRILFAILVIGCGVRLLYLVEQPSFPAFHQPEVDAHYYDQSARAIAAGDWVLGHEPLRMSPGYFYFLGSIYSVVGPGPWAPRLIQIALGLLLVWFVWDTARRVLGSWWAPWPAAVAAFYGPYLYFEGHLLADSLGAFLHALLMWCAVVAMQATDAKGARRWFGVGVVWGLCCVTRPNALPLLAPLAYAAWSVAGEVTRRVRTGWIAAIALGGALAIAPITARNFVASGQPVLLTSHGGINLFVGNGPGATGTWRSPPEVPGAEGPLEQFSLFHDKAEQLVGRRLTEGQADDYWVDRTVAEVVTHPVKWARLMSWKLYLYFNGRELHNVYDYEFWREVSLVLGPPLAEFLYIAPFGLAGLLLLAWRPGVGRFLALYAATIAAAIILVYVTDRYRLPVVAPLLVIGTAFVREMVAYARAARWRPVAGWFALWLAACVVAVPVKVNKRFDEKYHHLGEAWLHLNQIPFAEWALLKSLGHNPQFIPSHWDLATLYERRGIRLFAMTHLHQIEGIAKKRGDTALLARARSEMERLMPRPPVRPVAPAATGLPGASAVPVAPAAPQAPP